MIAAKAAYAAYLQGRFWQMHDLLFKHQGRWPRQKTRGHCSTPTPGSSDSTSTRFHTDVDAESTTDLHQEAGGRGQGRGRGPHAVVRGRRQGGVAAELRAVRQGDPGGAVTAPTAPAPLGPVDAGGARLRGLRRRRVPDHRALPRLRLAVLRGARAARRSRPASTPVILGVPVALAGADLLRPAVLPLGGAPAGEVGAAGARLQGARAARERWRSSRCSCCRRSCSRRSAPTASPPRCS